MVAKRFNELTTTELYGILCTRAAVFTLEEQILYPDADGLDTEAVHVFEKDENNNITAYLRMFSKPDEAHTVQMGRILTTQRKLGLGRALMQYAEQMAIEIFGAKELYLESQDHAIGFYDKCGFKVISVPFMEAGIPHVEMRKSLI